MSDAKDLKKGAEGKAGDAAAVPVKAGGSKLIPIVLGVNSLLLVGVMAFLVLQMKQQQQLFASLLDDSSKTRRADPQDKAEKGEKAEAGGKGEEKASEKKGEEKDDKPEPSQKGEHGEVVPAKGATMVRLADFVIHLRNPDADRYARMSFDVEVFGDSDKERLNASSPRVRDAFIGYLSDRTMEDLRGSEGLQRTKDALQTMLRQVAPDVRVRALYISDFVVQ